MREAGNVTLYADGQLTISSGGLNSLKLSGQVDAWNVTAVAQTLRSNLPTGDVYLDLSELSFADVDGIRALMSLANDVDGESQIVVRGLPSTLRRVLELVGWSTVPRFVFDSDGSAA
jgi:anti-anti-sigma regulatory factor